MEEKEIGRRKRTESAKKWREWALIMRFDSASTVHRFRDANGVAMADWERWFSVFVWKICEGFDRIIWTGFLFSLKASEMNWRRVSKIDFSWVGLRLPGQPRRVVFRSIFVSKAKQSALSIGFWVITG